jgi:lipopolysaccharide transport system ATP-binding protein
MWKRYGLGITPSARKLLDSIGGGEHRSEDDYGPWALRDINLEVRRGEALGIIGRNGVGKSTLLKILAGVSPHTRGLVEVRGQVFPMIELNAGLHMDLTGRENVYLLGAIMGLSRAEVRAKMSQIEEFCELGAYFDQPVRKYSSGMLARLGFGVAINVEAEILLVDEVLAVGDFAFQNKCQVHFRQRRGSQTLLYVTHDMVSLPYICDKAIYLVDGLIKDAGPSQEVIAQYERDSLSQAQHQRLPDGVLRRDTSKYLEIFSVRVTDGAGNVVDKIKSNEGFCLSVEGFCPIEITSPLFGVSILDTMGNMCLWNFSAEDGYEFDRLQGRFRVTVRIPPLPLRGGRYNLNFTIRDGEGFVNMERLYVPSVILEGKGRMRGILAVKAEWHLEQEKSLQNSEGPAARS